MNRLATLMGRVSGGHWGTDEATELIDSRRRSPRSCGNTTDSISMSWPGTWPPKSGSFTASTTRSPVSRNRIDELYGKADPAGIVISAPGVGPILAGGILGRLGDANRFANLAGVRSFSGMIPKVDQSGHTETRPGITKQGDAGLRRDIWFAADVARHIDPQLAAKYHRLIVERRLHHYSAICHLATTLLTRIAACWRRDERYVIRDIDGRRITPTEGKAIVRARYRIPPEMRNRARIPNTSSGSAK